MSRLLVVAAGVALTAAAPVGVLSWFPTTSCTGSDRTVVAVRPGVCNTVPGATAAGNTGYVVTCNANGTAGLFSVCDATCSTCLTNTPFANNACLANPPQYGARSLQPQCVFNETVRRGWRRSRSGRAPPPAHCHRRS